jgi:imidazolonepropionase-like amidohydrolase
MRYLFALIFFSGLLQAQEKSLLIKPSQVFDGQTMHSNWVVVVQGDSIAYAGPWHSGISKDLPVKNAIGQTLLPGLIEGHSHLFLHPYNVTPWNDQVLNESRAERTVRATIHAHKTLLAGFTTVRDLGTEGAAYDDAGLKASINKGLIPGPRMIIASKAIVAKGTYGPNSASADLDYPKGAAEVGNEDEMRNEVRTQISKGADVIKIYADYRWAKGGKAAPCFTIAEIKAAVEIASAGNIPVVAHASSPEGMKRAILAGVATIEHGDDLTPEIASLMKQKGVALCPTLAAGDAIAQYGGWKKGTGPEPLRISSKRKSFQLALDSGIVMLMGGDVGVYAHGDNLREMLLMHEYGMPALDVLKAATSINAAIFGYSKLIGSIQMGMKADLLLVNGNPANDLSVLANPTMVMKNGVIYK